MACVSIFTPYDGGAIHVSCRVAPNPYRYEDVGRIKARELSQQLRGYSIRTALNVAGLGYGPLWFRCWISHNVSPSTLYE